MDQQSTTWQIESIHAKIEAESNVVVQWTYSAMEWNCSSMILPPCILLFEILVFQNGRLVRTLPAATAFHSRLGTPHYEQATITLEPSTSSYAFRAQFHTRNSSGIRSCPMTSCYPIGMKPSAMSNSIQLKPTPDETKHVDSPEILFLISLGIIALIFVIRLCIFCQFLRANDSSAFEYDLEAHVEDKCSTQPRKSKVNANSAKRWLQSKKAVNFLSRQKSPHEDLNTPNTAVQYKLYSGEYTPEVEEVAKAMLLATKKLHIEAKVKKPEENRDADIQRHGLSDEEHQIAACQYLVAHLLDGHGMQLLHKKKKTNGKMIRFFIDKQLRRLKWGVLPILSNSSKKGERTMQLIDVEEVIAWTDQLPPSYIEKYKHLLNEPFYGVMVSYEHATKRGKKKDILLKCKDKEEQNHLGCSFRRLHEVARRMNTIV